MKTKKCAVKKCKRRVNQQEWKTEEEKNWCLTHLIHHNAAEMLVRLGCEMMKDFIPNLPKK